MKDAEFRPTGEPTRAPWQRHTSPPRRILVADDETPLRQFSTDAPVGPRCHMDAAEDGAAAWDTLQRNKYDLLVTDNDMPKVSGVELLHKLHAAHIALPVILATGSLPKEDLTRFPWIQPVALLIKPYSFHELLGTVRNVLRASEPTSGQAAPPDWQTGPPIGGLQC